MKGSLHVRIHSQTDSTNGGSELLSREKEGAIETTSVQTKRDHTYIFSFAARH